MGWRKSGKSGGCVRPAPTAAGPGFTLIELLVVVAVIALLMAILVPILRKVRAAGWQTVCLSNLKQLQTAWQAYADSNGDRIVNGAATPWGEGWTTDSEPWLIGWKYANTPGTNTPWTRDELVAAMKTGVLWPYVGTTKVYECAVPGPCRRDVWALWQPYSIVYSMNACSLPTAANLPGKEGLGLPTTRWEGKTVLYARKTSEITSPGSALRMVFLDTFGTYNAYGIPYSKPRWLNWPPGEPLVQHSDGTVASYADGHSQTWRWKEKKTIECGRLMFDFEYTYDLAAFNSQIPDNLINEDLYRMQRAVWGRLGYAPTPP